MASSTKNIRLGVCRAYYGGVDLGLTKGGVEVSVKSDTHKTEVDQFGKSVVKEQVIGRNVTAKVPMAETTLQNVASLMPGAALVTDGVKSSGTLTFGAITVTTTATIGGQAYTFYTTGTPANIYAVKIGATAQETIDNFVAAVNRSGLQKVLGGVVAVQTATLVVTIRAVDVGTATNAVTLVSASGITASAATLVGGTAATYTRLEATNGIGFDMLNAAQELRLHPIALADTDLSEDFIIYKAATTGDLSFAYKLDSERIMNADFTGYPDPITGKLFAIGA